MLDAQATACDPAGAAFFAHFARVFAPRLLGGFPQFIGQTQVADV